MDSRSGLASHGQRENECVFLSVRYSEISVRNAKLLLKRCAALGLEQNVALWIDRQIELITTDSAARIAAGATEEHQAARVGSGRVEGVE